MQTKVLSVLKQFINFSKTSVAIQQGSKDEEVPFMLKSKRLEYTFEFFRSQL